MKNSSIARRAGSALAMLAGCNANVAVSAGVPIGDNGYLGLGSGRWF